MSKELRLGNLDARRVWGYAPDYVEAIWLMLRRDEAEDFAVGTGEDHSVRELVEMAFDQVGLDPANHVVQDPELMRPAEVDELIADSSRAGEVLGWEPHSGFEELVRLKVNADVGQLQAGAPLTSA